MPDLQRKRDQRNLFADIARNPFSYLLLLPAFVYTFLFGYLTLPYMAIAFQQYNIKGGLLKSPFIGLKNFSFFVKSSAILSVTANTVILNGLQIIFGTVTAVLLAVILNEVRNRLFKKVAQSLFLLPEFISWVIVSYIVYAFLSTEYGFINRLIQSFGGEKINFYTKPEYWRFLLTLVNVWKSTGMTVVVYLATIMGMDEQIFEAAKVDGANRWQSIFLVMMPMLMPTVCIMVLMRVGNIFYGDFGMVYAVIGDSVMLYSTTDVIDTYVYRAFRLTGNIGQSTAIGLVQSLLGFVLVYGVNAVTKKLFPEGALF